MFETNTQNSALISLSRAAQLTGYHQDYLGQLCRLGKLPATKVGRNWFTSPEALNKLVVSPEEDAEQKAEQDSINNFEEVEDDAEATIELAQPAIVQTVTISQVEDMPIAIRTMPHSIRNVNTVQNLLTTMRIETLQREVRDLRQLLARLMTEVAAHSKYFQDGKLSSQADSLKHNYISNFDFNAPYASANLLKHFADADAEQSRSVPEIWKPAPPLIRFPLGVWITATAVVVAIVAMAATILTGQFFGPVADDTKTVFYHVKPVVAETPVEPAVAGEAISTPINGVSPQDVVQ